MNVACFTCFLPLLENRDGPNGLLYQTLRCRPSHLNITVFIFGQSSEEYLNEPEVRELVSIGISFITVKALSSPPHAPKYWPLGARNISRHEMPSLDGFDAVWAYPYWFSPFLRNSKIPVLISGMDCATLLYWRKLKNSPIFPFSQFLRAAAGLLANLFFEAWYLRGFTVHVVGQRDARILKWLGVQSTYISHPFLAYPNVFKVSNRAGGGSLTLLLSNPGDVVYGTTRYIQWVRDMFDSIRNEPAVRLLVHKGSLEALKAIAAAADGYGNIEIIALGWVDDYSALLGGIDIQLFPLDIGAGTKTSVLTALQHNVHSICSIVAAENIQPNSLLYIVEDDAISFKGMLTNAITAVKSKKNHLNIEGLLHHSPHRCGEKFWDLVEQHVN